MIDKKKIRKAAKNFCESLEDERKAIQQAELDKGANFAYAFIRPEAAFKAGINWFLDNLWHDVSEIPKDKSAILLRYTGSMCKWASLDEVDADDWKQTVKELSITRWCYINDILKKWQN